MPSYADVTQHAGSLRAMTGLTEQEFTALLPHFEHALAAYLQDRTMDGQLRTSRRYSTYDVSVHLYGRAMQRSACAVRSRQA